MNDKLFLPNNHSRYKIKWKICDGNTKEEISNLIRDNYDFDGIKKSSISQVQEWERMSNNFRVKVFKNGNEKEVLFRKHIQLKTKNDIDILDKTFDFLRRNNVSVPQIIKTKKGKTSFFSGKNFYVMYDFVKGDHYRGTLRELKDVARKIAGLHKTLKKIPFVAEISKKKILLPPWTVKGWKKILKTAERRKGKLDSMVRRNADFLLEEAERIGGELKRIMKVRNQVIHCDLHPKNTIFEKEKLKAILDFEGVRMGEMCRDVGNACHRFVRQFVVFQNKKWEKTLPVAIRIFLEEYNRINPLKKKEIPLLSLFIKDELLRKIYKDLGLYYFKNYSKNIEGGELEKKLDLLKEAKIIEKIMK